MVVSKLIESSPIVNDHKANKIETISSEDKLENEVFIYAFVCKLVWIKATEWNRILDFTSQDTEEDSVL